MLKQKQAILAVTVILGGLLVFTILIVSTNSGADAPVASFESGIAPAPITKSTPVERVQLDRATVEESARRTPSLPDKGLDALAIALAKLEGKPGNSIVVVVRDSDGQAQPGASVILTRDRYPEARAVNEEPPVRELWSEEEHETFPPEFRRPDFRIATVETDRSGIAVFDDLRDDEWVVWAATPESYYCRSAPLITEGDSSSLTSEIELVFLPASRLIRGLVLGPRGRPRAVPEVELFWCSDAGLQREDTLRRRLDGRFILRLPEAVEGGLIAARGLGSHFEQGLLGEVSGGARDLVVQLKDSKTLEVEVRDGSKQLSQAANLDFEVERLGHWVSFPNEGSLHERARVPRPVVLPLEKFRITVRHHDYPDKRFGPFDPATIEGPLRLDMTPFRAITELTGVVSKRGRRLRGVDVEVVGRPLSATTDSQGHFVLQIEGNGDIELLATDAEHGSAVSSPVRLVPGSSIEVDLELRGPLNLTGTVLFPGASSWKHGGVLYLYREDLDLVRRARINAQGRFRVESLEPGVWTASLTDPEFELWEDQNDGVGGSRPNPNSIEVRVALSESSGVVLDFRSSEVGFLVGTIAGWSDVEGSEGGKLGFWGNGNTAFLELTSNPVLRSWSKLARGAFSVAVAEPGRYGLLVEINSDMSSGLTLDTELELQSGLNSWSFTNVPGTLRVHMSPPELAEECEIEYSWSDDQVKCSGWISLGYSGSDVTEARVPSGSIQLTLLDLDGRALSVATIQVPPGGVVDFDPGL